MGKEGKPLGDRKPFLQGQSIRVCVQPTQQALDIGFRMRRIDRFTFIQGYVTQEAVINRQPSINGLTDLWCEEGSKLCMFETILSSSFFDGPAQYVGGKGQATLQFGSGEFNRYLQTRERNLQTSKSLSLDLFGVESFAYQEWGSSAFKISTSFSWILPTILVGLHVVIGIS